MSVRRWQPFAGNIDAVLGSAGLATFEVGRLIEVVDGGVN
jgi:hypothetical protein